MMSSAISHLRWNAGSVSGLASPRAREAGHYGKSYNPATKTQNIRKKQDQAQSCQLECGNLELKKGRSGGDPFRWRVDICGVQEHGYTGSLELDLCCILMGKNCKFKFFFCAQTLFLGGAGVLLANNGADKVIDWSPVHFWQEPPSQVDHCPGRFYHLSGGYTSRACLKVRRNACTTSCNMRCHGPSHWDTHCSWWLEQSCQLSFQCVEWYFGTCNKEGDRGLHFTIAKVSVSPNMV